METPARKIIHCDCDCFYAAVEQLDFPQYAGRPLAVGGAAARRGVIATCNYEARRFGVRSAMPTAHALRLCPELILVPPRMERYREVSHQVLDLFRDYTDLIEPLSLDEAYLDVSASTACQGSATLIAREIRQRVREEIGITLSAGVAPNKFLAKVASDWNKPDGMFVVTPAQVPEFVRQLPVDRLFGVGKVTAARLHELGARTCGELQALGLAQLEQVFGVLGPRLYQLCRGEDPRPVKPSRVRKSVSLEETFAQDLTHAQVLALVPRMYEGLMARLRRKEGSSPIDKCFVKLRFQDFVSTTLERRGQPSPELFRRLCEEALARGPDRKLRLLGLGVRFRVGGEDQNQLDLFDGPTSDDPDPIGEPIPEPG